MIQVPLLFIETVAALHFPTRADRRLQALMDGNMNGTLTAQEREELAGLVDLNETMAFVRAQAVRVLGRGSE